MFVSDVENINHLLLVLMTEFLQETGWAPRHIIAKDELEKVVGAVPLYLKRYFISEAVQTDHCHAAQVILN